MFRAVWFGRVISVFLGVAGFAAGLSESAAQTPSAESLRLQDVLAKVMQTNPKLQGQRYAIAGADARKDQAALRPALELGLDVENVLGTGRVRTFNNAEATLRLGTVLELGGKREKRVALADSERDLITIEKDAERLDILAEATRRFILVLAEQERLQLARQNLELTERTVNLVKQRVAQGRASLVEGHNAKLAFIQSEIAVQEQQSSLRNTWASLSASWGGKPERQGESVGDIFELPVLAAFSQLTDAVERNADIIRFATERRVNEAKLRLSEAGRTPDVSANLGIRRLQTTKDQAIVFSVAVPLGTSSRSAPFEREAQSRIESGRFEEATARNNLTATLYGLHGQVESARNVFAQLQEAALPEATQAERLTEEGYQTGRLSLLELTVARQSRLAVRQQAVTTAATYHQLFLEIERLTGQSMAVKAEAQNNAR